MKWVRLWVDEVIKGTTFSELTLAQRGLWWSLVLLAGDSLSPGIVECRKGEAYSLTHLSLVLNCDARTLKSALEKLVSVNKIAILKDKRMTIVNWKKYQTRYEKYYKNKGNGNDKNPENNGISMPDREEEDKKEKEDKEIAYRIIDYINEVGEGGKFTKAKRNLDYIFARMSDGFIEKDFRKVIKFKWDDPKFDRAYYRPSTLFNSDKFEGYLNSAISYETDNKWKTGL